MRGACAPPSASSVLAKAAADCGSGRGLGAHVGAAVGRVGRLRHWACHAAPPAR
ncbi:unnamed protein product, partial [Prorocentrum cordatum]